ncbi:MAG: alpha/beta hydrolase, partial [Candidatus Hydrogenedentales bacterium]
PRPRSFTGADDININVWDYGGNGPPLLLLHCTGTHGRVWDPLVPAFLPHFHVYAPETRGHGDSDTPNDPAAYHWRNSGEDLITVLAQLEDELAGKKLFGAGHSAGGAHLAYAEVYRPGTFDKMALIDPIIGPKELFRADSRLAVASQRRRNDFANRAAARARYASKPPMNAWRADVLDAYVEHGLTDMPDGTVTLKIPGPIEAAVYDHAGASDVYERLHELQSPVLLVTGDKSDTRNLVQLQRPRIPNVRFHQMPDTGHFIPQERPDETAQLLRDWFL